MVGTDFIFDGVDSSVYGLKIIKLNADMISEPYFGSKDIISDKNPNKDYSYFFKTQKNPITFELTFSLLNELWTPNTKYMIANWLVKDYYCQFKTEDYPDKNFYVICTNQGDLMTNGLEQGYITMEFENLYPYAMSDVFTYSFNLSNISVPTVIEITNLSNVGNYKPELQFTLSGSNTGLSIVNLTNNNKEFEFTGLDVGETIYVNNDLKQIISGTNGNYRLSKFNKGWLDLVYGVNQLQVTGKCQLEFRCQFPLYI